MFLTFLGPPTSLMIYSTVNHQRLPISDPTHLFDDVILEWSLTKMERTLEVRTYPAIISKALMRRVKGGPHFLLLYQDDLLL